REGSRVARGELLARLDARENQAAAAAAADGVDDASRALDEARAKKGLAETQHSRYEKLFKADAVSRQELDIKATELELAIQGVARAEARLRQARQQAKGADAFSDYTKIVAPIAGIITARHADLGATLFPGQPLFTIEDERGYQLELAIPESMSMTIKSGSSVDVTIDAVSARFTGKITDIVPSSDPASRTFVAKIPINQKGVKSGMFGRGAMQLGAAKPRITVPANAISERGALTLVWTVDSTKTAHMRIVKVGKQLGDRVEILSGITEGEQIITGSIEKVSDGAKVE
ncbi:MAG: efflux RND transporter periplasmic adaptor subunit, partial [Geobacteraceae bacterium]|nr:efflux RND transporter periplasmic adaptor subunit [Geobacteraceae bacterium]